MSQEFDETASISSSNYDKYLRLATDKNPSILLELDLDGNVKHVSKVWNSVVGTNRALILNKPISNIIIGTEYDKSVFQRALNMMLQDDNSYRVKFQTETGYLMGDTENMGLSSSSSSSINNESINSDDDSNHKDQHNSSSDQQAQLQDNSKNKINEDDEWYGNGESIELEAQGILVHDLYTQEPSHTMWIVKPFYDVDELDNLPYDLVKRLGFGAKIFSQYLQKIEDMMVLDEADLPNPNFELCRVCETMIPTWWLETHSQICVCEHRLESVVQSAQDELQEHRDLLESIITSLSKQRNLPINEYKGLPLPQNSSRVQSPSPLFQDITDCSDTTDSLDSTPPPPPQCNIGTNFKPLYLLKDLCDEALEVNISHLKTIDQNSKGTGLLNPTASFFQFSPNTEAHIDHVLNWNSTFDVMDPSINLLIQDTINLCRHKVETVIRMDNTLKYSLKVKNEVDLSISQLIKERIHSNRLNVSYTLDITPNNISGPPTTETLCSPQADMKLATPLPQRLSASSNLFSESYMGTDMIPEPHTFNNTTSEAALSQSYFENSRSNSAQLSKSVTPKQTVAESSQNSDAVSMETVSGVSTGSRSNPSTPKFSLNNYLHLPKLTSSISLTPRRGSPVNFHTPNASISQSNSQIHPTFFSSSNIMGALSTTKSVNENSPMLSPFISGSEGLPHSEQQQKVTPLSPLLLPTTGKSIVPSIKDYEVIKPISKGAYGSVYLAKKRVTGEYFAIKVLKKSDMIAKNQVTNVKSERAIMMVQSDKPYVAKLYATFQNRENLFLVMEYLSGGDMATLIKMMGNLPEKWAKQYICEVIVGVDDMHQNGIIHHDLKPDNLLIDSLGHIKLTDFGLSRMGLLRRHKEKRRNSQLHTSRKTSVPSDGSLSHKNSSTDSLHSASAGGSLFEVLKKTERSHSTSSSHSQPFSAIAEAPYLQRSGSHVSFTMAGLSRSGTPPLTATSNSNADHSIFPNQPHNHHSRTSSILSEVVHDSPKDFALFNPNDSKNFFGTPDYLAPETIQGIGESDTCDWWSVGCIFFEFLFGYPPFHGATADEVFENILAGTIDWPDFPDQETELEYISPEAKNLILKLLTLDPEKRLGANGSEEIKKHPYFKDVDWEHVYEEQPSFIPQVDNPEDTDYFDLRGASLQDFASSNYSDNDPDDYTMLDGTTGGKIIDAHLNRRLSNHSSGRNTPKQRLSISSVLEMVNNNNNNPESPIANNSPTTKHMPLAIPPHMRDRRTSKLNESASPEFGSFNYRNLNALDKANKDAITRLKSEHLSEFMHQRTSSSSISSSSSDNSGRLKHTNTGSTQASIPTSLSNRRSNSPLVLKLNSTSNSSPSRRNSVDTMNSQQQQLQQQQQQPIISKRNSDLSPYLAEESTTGGSSISSPLASKYKSPLSPPSVNVTPIGSSKTRKVSRNSLSSSTEDDERLSALSKVNSVRELRRRSGRKSSSNKEDIQYKLDVLLCEPIPIHRYRVAEDLESIGCSVVSVGAGDEMVRRATTGVKFDLIITAMKLSKIGAVDIAKLIRHTNSINCTTPIVALTVYYNDAKEAKVFDEVLEKPVSVQQLRKLVSKYALLKSQSEEDTLLSDTDF
ncbi:serine/threonine-protein kinase RIM15 [Kluyveromyces marxianus]|nr:serine/threonine-protein kinase RIM15 [Kluyveromyces marxianus]